MRVCPGQDSTRGAKRARGSTHRLLVHVGVAVVHRLGPLEALVALACGALCVLAEHEADALAVEEVACGGPTRH